MLLHDLTLSTSVLHDLPYKRKKTRSGYLLALIEVLTIYCPNNLVGITQITQVFQDTNIG
ncbi:hypothetical protein Hanom_Chr00s001089g01673771 [Helianthus anomalus]